LFQAARAHRLLRESQQASDKYQDLILKYPRLPLAARAHLGIARCLVSLDRVPEAMDELQRVRLLFGGSSEAAVALDWNSILYRLYIRPQAKEAPYTFTGRSLPSAPGRLEGVVGMLAGSQGRLVVATSKDVSEYDASGEKVTARAVPNVETIFRGPDGKVVAAVQGGLSILDPPEFFSVRVKKPDGSLRTIERIADGAVTERGDYILADVRNKSLALLEHNETTSGKAFPVGVADRMDIDDLGDVAFIEHEGKRVTVVDAFGDAVTKVDEQLSDPVDLQFDGLGFLYVLDRGAASVFVYRLPLEPGRSAVRVAAFSIGGGKPGEFRKGSFLSLDSAGRLSIYDGRDKRILFYR
jgi:hypothetical protein